MASNTNTNYKRCAVRNCHNASNGNRAFCEPCFQIRIAPERPCDACNLTIVSVRPASRLMKRLDRVYCPACTSAHVKMMHEKQEQDKLRDLAHANAYAKALDDARQERIRIAHKEEMDEIRIAHEKEMEVQRLKDEKKSFDDDKMRLRIDKIMSNPEYIRDMIYELYKELDNLESDMIRVTHVKDIEIQRIKDEMEAQQIENDENIDALKDENKALKKENNVLNAIKGLMKSTKKHEVKDRGYWD